MEKKKMASSAESAEEWMVNICKFFGESYDPNVGLFLAMSEARIDVLEWHKTNGFFNGPNKGIAWQSAVLGGFDEAIKWLQKNGFGSVYDPNNLPIHGNMPIHIMAFDGHIKAVEWLLDKNKDKDKELVNSKGYSDRTPMHLAASAGKTKMMKCLNDHGAEIYARDDGDLSPMDSAVACNQIESIKYLVRELGMEVNARNSEGRTPMFGAAMLGKTESMICLKNLGADVKAKDKYGYTPMHIAAKLGKTESIECLAALGADVEAKDNKGCTPMFSAVEAGKIESIKCLKKDLGADVDAKDNNDCTPIFVAAFSGDIEVMEYLKALGAELNVKAKNGMTPIDCAGIDNHTKAQEWLRKNMEKNENETEKSSFTDPRDGKTYKTVKIGNQVWMAENLAYECEGSKSYDNDPANGQKYGRLYYWEAAKKACPPGWHLPSNAEWNSLIDFAGGDREAGNILKASSGWAYNGNGVDSVGFSALPCGFGGSYGGFDNVGKRGNWWSSTEYNANDAYYQFMDYRYTYVPRLNREKSSYLYSVRCLQD